MEGGEVDSKLLPKGTVANGWSRQGNGMACYFHRTPVSARYAARSYFDVDFVGYCRQDDFLDQILRNSYIIYFFFGDVDSNCCFFSESYARMHSI